MYSLSDKQIEESIFSLTRLKVMSMKPVSGGFTLAKRYVALLEDGSSIFAKIATNGDTAVWLRAERNFYSQSNQAFHPKMLFW